MHQIWGVGYFDGKKIWITGASGGIGKEFAIQLSELGAYLILTARNKEKLVELQKTLAHPDDCEVYDLDMLQIGQIEDLSQQVLTKHKAIDILLSNAGVSQRSLVKETDFEVDKKIIDVNLMGPIAHTKQLLPAMLSQGSGHFVVMSSIAGKLGTPLRSAYAAAKHGLHGYFECLRAEEEDNGVAITIFTPGYIHTNVSSNALTSDGTKKGVVEENSKNGMSVDIFVKKALKAIEKQKKEVIIGGTETFGIYLMRFFPSIIRKIVKGRKP